MSLAAEIGASGFAVRRSALRLEALDRLVRFLDSAAPNAGRRSRRGVAYASRHVLWELPGAGALLQGLGLDDLASEALGGPAFPVSATVFDKNRESNWTVPAHQDLVVPVESKVESSRFSRWSKKLGVVHAEAPVEVLERLLALRIHLDDCGEANGPLAVLPGSHRREGENFRGPVRGRAQLRVGPGAASGTPSAPSRSRKCSTVRRSPSSRRVRGAQPSTLRASAISGFRCLGSS